MPAVAYLRKSRVDGTRPGDVSHATQLAAVQALATTHGDTLAESDIIVDWGKSGREGKTHLRRGYADLIARIEAGNISTLYSYSLSRLARSTTELLRLAQLCADKGVPIHLFHDGTIDGSTANGKMQLTFLGAVATNQADVSAEHSIDGIAARRARGDHIGKLAYGLVPGDDLAAVMTAYRTEGNFLRAARKLNAAGILTRYGKLWNSNSVAFIVRKHDPYIARPVGRGRASTGPHRLSGLLHDEQGHILTTTTTRSGAISYICGTARNDTSHPRPYIVAESKLLPWVADELSLIKPRQHAADLSLDGPDYDDTNDNGESETELEEERERIAISFIRKEISPSTRDTLQLELAGRLERIRASAAVERYLTITSPDEPGWEPTWAGDGTLDVSMVWRWGESPIEANKMIRSVLHSVTLGDDLLPVSALWINPDLRGSGTSPIARVEGRHQRRLKPMTLNRNPGRNPTATVRS